MYSRIRYDIFFKKIFQQEHLLKAFLNTVLVDELPAPITAMTYHPTEFISQAERQYLNLIKHTMIDVFVTTADGTRAIVEIQKGTEKTDLLRFVDYQCRNFSHQFRVGETYTKSVPCYSICWLFDMTPPHKEIKEKIRILSDKKQTDWQVQWEIIAIYPRCIKHEHLKRKTLDALEEWLLLDVVTDTEESKRIHALLQTQEVKEAFEQLDVSGLTEQEIEELEFQQAVTDRYRTSYEKRIQEVEREKARMIAKSLRDVLDMETICQKTGLSADEIEGL